MLFKKYFPEFVYGGMDGLITTFAIIAGATGAGLSADVIVIVGIASVFSDAFSMGASNFVSRRSACRIGNDVCKPNEPFKTALSTFLSFLLIGFVPVFPFILPIVNPLVWSISITFAFSF